MMALFSSLHKGVNASGQVIISLSLKPIIDILWIKTVKQGQHCRRLLVTSSSFLTSKLMQFKFQSRRQQASLLPAKLIANDAEMDQLNTSKLK